MRSYKTTTHYMSHILELTRSISWPVIVKVTKRPGSGSPRVCLIMRPSSLGGGRILRRTLSVCLSVCPSVCPSVPLADVLCLQFYSCTVLRANIQNRKTSVFAYGPASPSRHVCTFRHAQRAAYRTAISAAQSLVIVLF